MNKCGNDAEGNDRADKWYNKMDKKTNDRDWREPTEFELMFAVKHLKKTDPGTSGVPAVVWKALIGDKQFRLMVLKFMTQLSMGE